MRSVHAISLIILFCYAPPISGQQRVRIPTDAACAECRLTLEQLVTLSDNGRREWLGSIDPLSVARDASGNFLVATYDRGVTRFSTEGAFLNKIGGGPLDEDRVSIIRTDANSIHLLTTRTNRWVIASQEGDVIRSDSILFRQPGSAALLDKGVSVTNEVVQTDALAGRPLHVRDAAGKVLHSFGEQDAPQLSGLAHVDSRELAPADSGRFWSAERVRYVIHLLDKAGREHKTVVRDSDLFPDLDRRATMTITSPYPPTIRGLHSDAEGRLWVLIDVPQNTWRKTMGRDTSGAYGNRLVPTNLNDYFDTIVEILDPKSGKLLATLTSDPVLRFLSDGTLFSKHGFPTWDETTDTAYLRIYLPHFISGQPAESQPGDGKPGLASAERDVLQLLATRLPPTVIPRLLSQKPWDVALNEQRRAVQVLGCNNIVMAHFPLEEAELNTVRKLIKD